MSDKRITRTRFMWDSLVGAAGIAVGLSAVKQAAAENKALLLQFSCQRGVLLSKRTEDSIINTLRLIGT